MLYTNAEFLYVCVRTSELWQSGCSHSSISRVATAFFSTRDITKPSQRLEHIGPRVTHTSCHMHLESRAVGRSTHSAGIYFVVEKEHSAIKGTIYRPERDFTFYRIWLVFFCWHTFPDLIVEHNNPRWRRTKCIVHSSESICTWHRLNARGVAER